MPEETEATESTEAVDNLETSTEVPQEPAYTVKIDGEEQQVTLEELQQGYQRQADYTRKNGEIVAERDRLQQAEAIVSALEHDPGDTKTAHSFNVAPITGQQASDDEYAEVDPTQQKLAELEQKIAEARANRKSSASRARSIYFARKRYGEFNREELLNHALKNGIPNLEEFAYTHMRFNDVKSTADKLSQEQEITNKKRVGDSSYTRVGLPSQGRNRTNSSSF